MSSPITKRFIRTAALLACLLPIACGDANTGSTFNTEEGAHPPGWLPSGHAGPARENPDACRSCHGADLSGGITNIGCTACHIGGPLMEHPETFAGLPWLQGGHGRYVVANSSDSCKNIWCHGPTLQGVPGSGQSCSTCHGYP